MSDNHCRQCSMAARTMVKKKMVKKMVKKPAIVNLALYQTYTKNYGQKPIIKRNGYIVLTDGTR